MPIRLPGLDVREPLRTRPVVGGIVGAFAGAFFAIVAEAGAFSVPRVAQSLGFLTGGLVAGTAIGSLAPLFRKRLSAGFAVSCAITLGLLVANAWWRELRCPLVSVPFGLAAGAVYAAVFWDYRGEVDGSQQ